jgi:RNA polymerase sigma-70 factor, ECF subfamily
MINISKDLMFRAARGDMAAFEEIYKISSGYVYAVAYRVTGKKEDAEEVTQDVFISVYRNLRSFAFRSAFSTWIYRIAMNTAINLYRKRSKERGRTVPFDDAMGTKDHAHKGDDASRSLEKKDNEKLVQSMLGCLPEDQRACIVMKDLEGLKYEEIARALNINLNTVRSRLSRAREKLVSLYGKEERP